MELNIDSKAIQEHLVKSIIETSIGENIKSVINEYLTEKESYYNKETLFQKSVKKAIDKQVLQIIGNILHERRDEIEEAVKQVLTEEAIKQVSEASIQLMIDKMNT